MLIFRIGEVQNVAKLRKVQTIHAEMKTYVKLNYYCICFLPVCSTSPEIVLGLHAQTPVWKPNLAKTH